MKISALVWYAISWFIPVINYGPSTIFTDGKIKGWQAFRLSCSYVWPYAGNQFDSYNTGILSLVSALTNLAMISAPIIIIIKRLNKYSNIYSLILLSCFIWNTHYIFQGLLRIEIIHSYGLLAFGYYMWLLSFLLLSIGMRINIESQIHAKA